DADWVLYLDADERMDGELVQDVHKKVNQAPQQYAFTRRAVVCDYTFHHGAFKPDQVFRLFPRQAVVWENKVHERPVCSLAQKQLAGEVKHYTYDNWQAWINKMGAYTTIWATDNFAQGKRTSLSGAVGHMLMGFGKMFFLQLGFLDGVKGLISTSLHCSYTLFKYLKLLELQRREGIK
ncbi:MAG: glycosyltransferase family 2 protein, partial [Acidaminococcaceae bacterium]